MNSSRLSAFCDRALEAGWLIGITITPVFFNVYSSRVFEPDKLTTLRTLAVVMAILWIVRFVDGALRGDEELRISWKTPMVLPALSTMVVYLLSSVLSLVPYTSFVGSYQRLQGTFSLFGYLVLFFAMLTGLRTRLQLSRLLTVLILNSLPVSLYGIIQRQGADPLPWAGNVQTRVASNMGNAIFVAAYLIMIVPFTAARIMQSFTDILSREEARISDILRASAYVFILFVQLLTIWYSKSRGPWLGIVAAGFLLPYLALIILQRQAGPAKKAKWWKDVLKGLGIGLASLALIGGMVGLGMLALEGSWGLLIGGGFGVLAFGGLWLYLIAERRGWRWLWISWGSIGLSVALLLLSINLPGPLHEAALDIPSLNRLARITQLESGTGKVRVLIWEGALELISPHKPIEFPDGSVDPFNAIRPIIGYGPESMYVAYNSFYPPELGHYESRTASPDRSHNETLDSVVITGVLGLLVYLFTFGSIFYWGFKWLGLLNSRGQFLLFLGLSLFFSVVFFIIGWQLEGLYLFAIAIPLGILTGMMIYLTIQAFLSFLGKPVESGENWQAHPQTLLIIAILTSVIAHFVEINFGIAIAATRTTFWAIAALMVALGLNWVPAAETSPLVAETEAPVEEVSRSRGRRRRSSRRSTSLSPWLTSVIALSLVGVFLLGTLAFDFINNPQQLTSASEILVSSLTQRVRGESIINSLAALMIFFLTWALFGLVGLSEYDNEGLFSEERDSRWMISSFAYLFISFLGFLIFGSIVAGHQAGLLRIRPGTIEDIVGVANMLAGLLRQYYVLIFTILILTGLFLLGEEKRQRDWGHPFSYGLLLILLLPGIWLIRTKNYDLIRADVIFKQGGTFANARDLQNKQIGIAHYEESLDYVPREDYYNLFLGKTYLELAQGLPSEVSSEEREEIFETTEDVLLHAREINPLNTDHSANLARFYKSWAARVAMDMRQEDLSPEQKEELQAEQDRLLQLSLENYEIALTLSPNNPIIWNELAQLYALDLKDMVKYQETISHSLELDPEFETTWMLIGDMRSSSGDVSGAIVAYQNALDVQYNCTVARVLGTLQAQLERWDDAIVTLEAIPEQRLCANFGQLWEVYRVLAISYANDGDTAAAMAAADTALSLAPEDQHAAIESLRQTLLEQSQTVPEEAQP